MDQNFLQDLDELESDNDEFESQDDDSQNEKEQNQLKDDDIDEEREGEEVKLFQQEQQKSTKIEPKEISYLSTDESFTKHMQLIKGSQKFQISELHLVVQKSNEYGAIISREIQCILKFIKDIFIKKFSELEQIVVDAVDYVNCVKEIEKERDLSKVNFEKLLTSHQLMAVKVAASSSQGKELLQQEWERVLKASDLVIQLSEDQKKIQFFIEAKLRVIAPNLSALVGTTCAAQLIILSGGIEALSRMPACNIQVMGSKKIGQLGFSLQNQGLHRGCFGNLEMVEKTPPEFQTRLVRMLSTNVAKCIKIDFLKTCPDASAGKKIKNLMIERLDKIMDDKPNRAKKIVPIPEDKPSKRRGGKKFQKIKEKFALTAVRQNQNRLKFGLEGEEEYLNTGKGYGMLSASQGTGKIKVQQKKIKLNNTKAMQKRLVPLQQQQSELSQIGGGIYSTITMTPIQGMELKNPSLLQNQMKRDENYFKKDSGFRTVIQQKINEKQNEVKKQ